VLRIRLNPSEILRTLKRERATALIAVRACWTHCASSWKGNRCARLVRPGSIRLYAAADGEPFCASSGGFAGCTAAGLEILAFISAVPRFPRRPKRFFKRIGYAVVQGYGRTETASLDKPESSVHAAQGSVGRFFPAGFRLAEDGEILVRGEKSADSYWQGGECEQRRLENDGWLRTGNLGELDAEGNLRFRGRKKSVIVHSSG